ncbi:hypothetical protein RhiirA4_427978 [Rhizophagus irregularis]|uniref:Uncharacterized protein n=1 Tax=Rhizophagus irregularis TaxID=588596 RepID=A0A2I1HAZ7_9GLOM|nr:hypothetical protein RhiirA4_427978 [Rhizophagus irregularis]
MERNYISYRRMNYNKLDKILTDFEKSFSSAAMKVFMDKLQEEQEQSGFDTAFDINVSITSACTVKALKDGELSSRFSFRKRAKINYAEPSCSPNEETDSDYEVRNILPNGTKIVKSIPLDLTPSDKSEDDESSLTSVNVEDEDGDNDDIS